MTLNDPPGLTPAAPSKDASTEELKKWFSECLKDRFELAGIPMDHNQLVGFVVRGMEIVRDGSVTAARADEAVHAGRKQWNAALDVTAKLYCSECHRGTEDFFSEGKWCHIQNGDLIRCYSHKILELKHREIQPVDPRTVKLTGAIYSGLQGNGCLITAEALRDWAKKNGHKVTEFGEDQIQVEVEFEGEYEIGLDKIVRKRGEVGL